MTVYQELDSIMGTTSRIPRLLNAEGFPEWKYRIEKYIKMKDFKIWRSILRGPIRITTIVYDTIVDKRIENYTDEDFEKVKEKRKPLLRLQ